jgi:uncharacterized protein involved in outer membrane biogenesis
MRKLFRSRLFWLAAIPVLLVGLYALLGYYAAPKLIRSQATKFVATEYGRALQIGEVRVDPFRLQVEVKDLVFPDADRSPMLGFDRLFIDFELSSIWRGAFVFREVTVDRPGIKPVIRPDGSMNLADLAVEDDEPEEPLPSVLIEQLAVNRGVVGFIDQARAKPFARKFEPIEFRLENFRTTPEGGDFSLTAESSNQEKFAWKGRFALAPDVSSSGDLSIEALRVPGVAEFLGDALPFEVSKGMLNVAGSYQLVLGKTTELKLQIPKIEVDDLGLRARGLDEDWVEIPAIVVSETKVAIPEQTVDIGRIELSSMSARIWLDAEGALSLDRLFAPPAAAPNPPESGPAIAQQVSPAPPPAPEAEWAVHVGALGLKQSSVDFEDRSFQPALAFAIAPLDVELQDLSLDLGKPLPISFSATIDGTARIKGQGTVKPEPLAVGVDFALDSFDLRKFQPIVAQSTDMTLQRGVLGMTGRLELNPPDDPAPELSFAGDVNVEGLRTIDNALERDFINVDRLELRKLSYAMAPDALSIDRVNVHKPYANVIIASNQVLNVAAVFDPVGTTEALRQREAAAKAAEDEAARPKTRAEIKAQRKAQAERKKAEAAARKARAAAGPVQPAELEETGMPIRIRQVRVEQGKMSFADFNVQPNFAADVFELHGSIDGLSSDPNSRAKVDLKGKVGEFSPVTIGGEVQLFAFDRYTDIALKFENISLPIFNPYSGRFAGYAIAKGKLTTELDYLIQNRALEAQHKIRIDQLEWGEATDTKGEASLPVKFATSLLKDKDGVINLDVPITGTLDDPKFRIGPIVWQIVKNIITKAVTAPFKFLGSLFAGAEEAQFVDFAPGVATLEPAVAETMTKLGTALVEKPEIKLDIPIGTVAELDRPVLVERDYQRQVDAATRKVVLGKRADSEAPTPVFDTLPLEQKVEVMTAALAKASGTEPQIPAPPPPPEGTKRKEAKALEQTAALEYLQTEMRGRISVPDADLDALGQARAEAVQKALLQGGQLEPTRVFLATNGKVTAQDGKVRFELALK